jgi:adenylate cyclase
VSGFPRRELADRADVDSAYVDQLVNLGLLTPGQEDSFSVGDLRRVRLLKSLEQAGMPLEGMAAAVGSGHLSFAFLDLPNFERLSALSGKTFRELSTETGVPVELLQTMREAIGFAHPSPDDHVREDEMQIVTMIEQQYSHGFSVASIERLLRVYGESLRRVGETEGDWFHTQFMKPLLDTGMGDAQALETSSPLAFEFMQPQEQTLTAMYHAHQEHAMVKNITEMVENSLEQAGVRSKLTRPPAMCFLDLSGYTRLTEERGDEAAAELAGSLSRLVQRTSHERGGWPVKWLGDGVMFYFKDPGGGVLAALEMVERVPDAGLPPARVGLDAGPVIFQEGDYFGRTVNNAARIAAYARPDEVLVTQQVVEASDIEGVTFMDIGAVELKGVAQPLRLHSVSRERADPVAR